MNLTHKHKFIILSVIFAMTGNTPAESTIYYVSQDGANKNSGLSWSQAWRTLEHAGQMARAGDQVLVRKGVEPYRYLPIIHSGSESEPIIFKGEIKEDPPVITGGIKETRWKPSPTPGVWRVETSSVPILLMEDGRPLVEASSQSCTDGRWYWNLGELRYRPSSGDPNNHDVWRSSTGGGVQIGNNSWIVIEDLKCWLGQGACVSIDEGSYNVVRGIHAQWYGRGLQIRGGRHNLVEGSLFENNREGVYLSHDAAHNLIQRCNVLHNGNLPIWKKLDRSGIAIGDVGINIGNQIIANEVAFNGGPHSDPGLIAYDAPQTLVEGNFVHDNYYGGILIGIRSHNSSAIANRVERNGASAIQAGEGNVSGLSVRRSRGVTVKNNVILDNYVSSSDPGRYDDPIGAGMDLKGNSGEDMSENKFIGNVVCRTKNGPDVHFSSVPDTTGLVHELPQTSICTRN